METKASTGVRCPTCGNNGTSVKPLTLRALLNDKFVDNVADVEYRFCSATDCDVVYYGNGQIFTKSQLNVPVGVKEKTGERPLCYCFGHSVASITDELLTKGNSDALNDIRQKMEDPGCRCETENPCGSCCLGSVAKGIETAKAELRDLSPSPPANRTETMTQVGTLLSAVMASSCCWLPLLLLMFGVSGAGIAGVLDSYRPVFVTLTFSFLAAAFYFTYRPRKTTAGDRCAEDCCSTSDAPRRFHMMTFNKLMLWVVTVVAVVITFFPVYVGLIFAGNAQDDAATSNPFIVQTAVAVDGMHCEACAAVLKQAIEDVPGVLNAKVDYKSKQASVSTEACCAFPQDAVLKAIQNAGYTGSIPQTKDGK